MTRTPLSRSQGRGHQTALVGCSSRYIIYMDDTIIYTTAQSEPLPVDHEYSWCDGRCRHKACMGWSWAVVCGVQGHGHSGFPHSLFIAKLRLFLLQLSLLTAVIILCHVHGQLLSQQQHHHQIILPADRRTFVWTVVLLR